MASGVPLYRALVRLYPRDFRRAYSNDLVQLFADLAERDGAAAAWRRTLVDLAVTVPRYRLETVMSTGRPTAAVAVIAAIVAALTMALVALFATGFGLVVALVAVLVVAGIAVVRRSSLGRSLRPPASGSRRRAWILSGVFALVAIAVLAIGMVDLGGDDHWPAGKLAMYNLAFFGAGIAALATFVVALRWPRSA